MLKEIMARIAGIVVIIIIAIIVNFVLKRIPNDSNIKRFIRKWYNVPLVKTQMKKIIVTAKTLYSHPKNVSKIYAALHTDLAW